MKTSRQRVLELISAHRLVTTTEISRGLKMTRSNARHHLEILISQGLVEKIGKKSPNQRGRPSELYGVSQSSQGNNLDRLADALLSEIATRHQSREGEFGFHSLVKRMVSSTYQSETDTAAVEDISHLTKRLVEAIPRLNAWHYHARWEAHVDSPHLMLGNCPYRAILDEHPELCEIDRHLLGNLIHPSAEQVAKRIPDDRGLPYCLFRFQV